MKPLLARYFGVDVRSLAALRIGLGLVLLVDLANRARDLVAHYTDAGVLPRSELADYYGVAWRWSVLFLDGSPEFVGAVFAVAALAALCLLVGYHTRLATIICWVMAVSIQTRNPLVVNAGDTLLRMLLLWSVFLPLGAAWSLDAGRRRSRVARAGTVVSIATAGILLQVCLVYWMSGYFKFNDIWLSGDGLLIALAWDAYAKPLAAELVARPQLARALSLATLWGELIGPLLLFFPIWTKYVRMLVIAAFVCLHVGVELTMTVGLFSYVSIVAWTVVIPDIFWDALHLRATEPDPEDDAPASALARWGGRLGQCGAGLLLAVVVAWNIQTTEAPGTEWIASKPLRRPIQATMAMQKWSMFSRPPTAGGWLIASAQLADRDLVDLLRDGAPMVWDEPENVASLTPNHRWRKLHRNLSYVRSASFHKPYCEFLVRDWNARHDEGQRVERLQLLFMKRKTSPVAPYEEPQLIQYYLYFPD
jgi:hypothetical protein